MDGHVRPLGRDDVRGILQRGGTILGTSRRDPYVHGDGYASVRRTVEANGIDAVIVIGGDGTLRTALALQRGRARRRRRAEDDRQRHRGHRHDVRVRHGRLDRDRGARPHLDDGRVAQPDHGRRGDGPHEGLDRDVRRHRRRGRRDPGAGARDRPGAGRRDDPAPATGTAARTRSSSSRRAASAAGRRRPSAPGLDAFGFERLGGVGYALRRRARAADRVRDAGDRARAPAARRHPDRVRPGARDALRRRRRRPRGCGPVRRDGRAARHATSSASRSPRRARRCAASTRRCSTSPGRSSGSDAVALPGSSRSTSTARCCAPTAPCPTARRAAIAAARSAGDRGRRGDGPLPAQRRESWPPTPASAASRSAPTAPRSTTSTPTGSWRTRRCRRRPRTGSCVALRERFPGIVFGWEYELRFGSEPAYEALRDPTGGRARRAPIRPATRSSGRCR